MTPWPSSRASSTCEKPVIRNPAATVRADSEGNRRLSIQYREYESNACCAA